jgi:elongation factor 1-gamma
MVTMLVASKSDTSTLLGATRRDYYDIIRWMSFANGDLLPAIGGCLLPLIGRRQIIVQDSNDSIRALRDRCGLIEQHLHGQQFLVAEQLTLADLFVFGMLTGAYVAWNKTMEVEYPEVSRWFYAIAERPMVKGVTGQLAQYHLPFPTLSEANGEAK